MAKKLRSANSSVAEKFIESTEKKPTTEELEAQGQTRLISEDGETKETPAPEAKKHEQEKKEEPAKQEQAEPAKEIKAQDEQEPVKKSMGQPKKYAEPTKHISFALPVSVIENLKILAGLRKTNQTQLILGLINREIELEADRIEAYKELLK